MWGDMCVAIGREDLIEDPRYKRGADRAANHASLRAEIGRWTLERDKYEAMRILAEGGVPASAVLDTRDLFDNPHLLDRGFVHTVEHEEHGTIRLLGWPARMSRSQVPIKAAPRLGRDTREVIAADLGLAPESVDALVEAGVVAES